MEQALVPLLRMDLLTLSSDSVTCLLRKVPEPTICKLSRPSFLGLLFIYFLNFYFKLKKFFYFILGYSQLTTQ